MRSFIRNGNRRHLGLDAGFRRGDLMIEVDQARFRVDRRNDSHTMKVLRPLRLGRLRQDDRSGHCVGLRRI